MNVEIGNITLNSILVKWITKVKSQTRTPQMTTS